jgi:hypothetical protein
MCAMTELDKCFIAVTFVSEQLHLLTPSATLRFCGNVCLELLRINNTVTEGPHTQIFIYNNCSIIAYIFLRGNMYIQLLPSNVMRVHMQTDWCQGLMNFTPFRWVEVFMSIASRIHMILSRIPGVGSVTNNTTRVRIGYRIYSLWRLLL